MNVNDFDFDLPNDRIALRPSTAPRMLVVQDTRLTDSHVSDLSSFLRAGDVLVFNDTRVIPGRLFGKRGAAKIEVTLHKRCGATQWQVFAKPAKKARSRGPSGL